MRAWVAGASLAVAVAVTPIGVVVHADHGDRHQPEPMVIEILHPTEVNLEPTLHEPSLHPSSLLYGSLTVYVSDVNCGTTTLPPVESRPGLEGTVVATIVVGAANQPGGCHVEDAPVTFVNGRGQVLGVQYPFRGGTTEGFDNFAPLGIQPGQLGDGVSANTGPIALPGAGSGGVGDGRDNVVAAAVLAAIAAFLASAGVAIWLRNRGAA